MVCVCMRGECITARIDCICIGAAQVFFEVLKEGRFLFPERKNFLAWCGWNDPKTKKKCVCRISSVNSFLPVHACTYSGFFTSTKCEMCNFLQGLAIYVDACVHLISCVCIGPFRLWETRERKFFVLVSVLLLSASFATSSG